VTQPVLKGSCILSAQDIANKIRGHGGASLGLRVQCASFCFPKSQDHCYEPRSLPQAYFKASSAFLPLQYLTQSVYSDTIQRRKIWAISLTYTTAHGNTGSPTQWARPGIEPESSWILVRFVSPEPQKDLSCSPERPESGTEEELGSFPVQEGPQPQGSGLCGHSSTPGLFWGFGLEKKGIGQNMVTSPHPSPPYPSLVTAGSLNLSLLPSHTPGVCDRS